MDEMIRISHVLKQKSHLIDFWFDLSTETNGFSLTKDPPEGWQSIVCMSSASVDIFGSDVSAVRLTTHVSLNAKTVVIFVCDRRSVLICLQLSAKRLNGIRLTFRAFESLSMQSLSHWFINNITLTENYRKDSSLK